MTNHTARFERIVYEIGSEDRMVRVFLQSVDIPFVVSEHRRSTTLKHNDIGLTEGADMPQHGINVLALLKGQERFVFLYDDESADQLLQTLGKYAADPELNFSWYDAATLSQRVRKLRESETTDQAEPKNRIRRSAA